MSENMIRDRTRWWISLGLFLMLFSHLTADAFNDRHLKRVKETGHCKRCDLSQIDLRSNIPSGLEDAMRRLPGIKGISFVKFNEIDVFRHPLVAKVVKAYDN